ncbi:MAG: hypothetical protein MJZ33_13945 [Paludibacteraceae bacterium]|nr:hypothetical protein [Paludibacteraceae bacterium]
MNKKMNYWLALSASFVMATSPVMFSSCSDDDDDDDDPKKEQNEANKGEDNNQEGNGGDGENNGSNPGNGHSDTGKVGKYPYVDLGLPSGLKWATYNVGATKPEEYGDYFAWGETKPQADSDTSYSWATYKWCNGNFYSMTKYCSQSFNGTVDSLNTLLPEDDAATANWGSAWRMPTDEELDEMIEGCNWEWTKDYNGTGVSGQIGTSETNGNTIFFPAAGCRDNGSLNNVGFDGYYCSSSLKSGNSYSAYVLDFGLYYFDWCTYHRHYGLSVRAVSGK